MSQATVLVVCTGNICRSPLAAGLLGHLRPEFSVLSAGTRAFEPAVATLEIRTQAHDWGFSLDDHRAQELTSQLIQSADVILTAERAHRAEVVALEPSAMRKAFTIKQIARVAEAWSDAIASGAEPTPEIGSFADLVSELADYRALTLPPHSPDDDDISDPFLRSQAAYDHSAQQISAAVNVLAQTIERQFPGS